MATETVVVQVARPAGAAPARYGSARVCAIAGCATRLSSYNPHHTCFRHTPVRYPRVRGRVRTTAKPSPRPSANARRDRS